MSEVTRAHVGADGAIVSGAQPSTDEKLPDKVPPRITLSDTNKITATYRQGVGLVTVSHESLSHNAYNADAPSILASARTQAGMPIGADRVNLDSIVTWPDGSSGRVREAITAGLLKQDTNGRIVEVTAEELAARAEAAKANQPQGPKPDTFSDPAAEGLHQALTEALPEQQRIALAVAMAHGRLDAGRASDFAVQAGINPAEFAEGIEALQNALAQQAAAAVKAKGVDPAAFFQWAGEHHLADFRRAGITHATTRNAGAYGELVQRYLSSVAVDPAALAEHRKDVKIVRKGATASQTVVRFADGRETTLAVAQRLGWL